MVIEHKAGHAIADGVGQWGDGYKYIPSKT
jgi:hypothetical protein